jgi:hypothetical protein
MPLVRIGCIARYLACHGVKRYGHLSAAADRPVIFPEPQEVTLREDGFPVDEQVPVLFSGERQGQ